MDDNTLSPEQRQEAQERNARLHRLSSSAATETLPLLNTSYPIAILGSDIHTAPIGPAPVAAAAGGAADAGHLQRDPKVVAHHLIFAMPERLMQKNDGMLNCLRGEGAEGTMATMFQRCYEFVLQSLASALQQLQAAEMNSADLARAHANVPAMRAFIECVVRDVPDSLPLQRPDAEPLSGLSAKLSVEEHVLTFAPENILGYRLHIWIFDRTLHPARMFASRITQTQSECELISMETRVVRSSLFRDPNNMDRAKATLHMLRRANYCAKHPDADAEEIDEVVPEPSDAEVHAAVERARRPPTADEIKNARIQYQRSATELGFSIYDYEDMARFVHGVYLTAANKPVPANGTFVEPHVLSDQSLVPGYRGHVREMAHYNIFNFANSVDLLHAQNDMRIMQPLQACAENYGLARPGDRLSFPLPHLVWELPVYVLNPRMLVLYKAPWRQQTTFDVLARRYEKAIRQSQERERRRIAREGAAEAAAAAAAAAAGASSSLFSSFSLGSGSSKHASAGQEVMDDTTRLVHTYYMNSPDVSDERQQSNRFGSRRRNDPETVAARRELVARTKRQLETMERYRASLNVSATTTMDVDAPSGSGSTNGNGNGDDDGVVILANNDAQQADAHMPYHEMIINHKQVAHTGVIFDRLFAVDKVTQDYSAVCINNTITILREENAPLFDRVERIISQWPPPHAKPPNGLDRWTESARAEERDRCARELTDALFQETARRFVHRLSSMDANMSDLFIGIMRKLQREDPASFVQPAFVRMPDYTLSAQANAVLLRDLGDAYNVRTMGTFAREAVVHMPADAVRPGHFVPAPRAVIGPPGAGKSLSTSIAMYAFPIPNFGPVMYESRLSKMGGDRNQSHAAHVRDEMSSIMQNHSKENHEKRRDEVEQRKAGIGLQAVTFERLHKNPTTGRLERSRVHIERRITEWELGNYMVMQLGAETALADRYRWLRLMPRTHVGSQDEGANTVYNFGQAQNEKAQRLFVTRRQRATCIMALMAAASDCGVLPRCDTQVFGAMMTAGIEDIKRFLPHLTQKNRLLLRGHTLAYAEALNTAHFKCMQSPASPYLMWDVNSQNIVGVKPFRLETMRDHLGTSLFCQPPDALNAMTITFFEHYPMEAYFLALSAATALCGFDSSKFAPLYRAANFLPDVVGRAREFLPMDQRGMVKPPLPDYILEWDRILEDMRFAARTTHCNGAIYDTANRGQDINPMFVVFEGNYNTFIHRLTALMNRYGRIDPPQVRSILDVLKHMQLNVPVLKLLPRGTAVDSTTIAFERVDEATGSIRQSNNVPHMRSAPQEGGLRHTSKGGEIVWRSYAALTIYRADPHGGGAGNGSRALVAASALTGGNGGYHQRGGGSYSSSSTAAPAAAAGNNGHENVATNDEGNTVKLLVHYLMLRPDHLYYLFSTAWMDRTTESVKTLVPIDVFDHPGVWHQVQIGPRYGIRLNMTNPNYQSDASRMLLNAYDFTKINQVLPGDHRPLAAVKEQNIDVGARHPTISYRFSLVFDLWLKFLRENYIFPTQSELEWIRARRDAIRAAPAELVKLTQLPDYLRDRFLDMSEFEAWAALHRDRYLMPEHFVKTAQRTSPQLLAMLTAPIDVVDNLRYPHSLIVGNECERYVHTIVRNRFRQRPRYNPNHRVSLIHCTRTLTPEEHALLEQFRDGSTRPGTDEPANELGYMLQAGDDDEADRSFNMTEIIIQTCAVKAVLKHEDSFRANARTVLLALDDASSIDIDVGVESSSSSSSCEEHAEKTRNQWIKLLTDGLRAATAPRNEREAALGRSFVANATPALRRVHDRVLAMLYEYYVLRLVDLKKRACMRAAVLSVDMKDQLRFDGKLHAGNTHKSDDMAKPVVHANLSPLERLLLNDETMKRYVLPSSAKALLLTGSSSFPSSEAGAPGGGGDDDGGTGATAAAAASLSSAAACDRTNIADTDETTRLLQQRVIGSVGFLYDHDEILVSESETDSRSRWRRHSHQPHHRASATVMTRQQQQQQQRSGFASGMAPVVIAMPQQQQQMQRRPGGFSFATQQHNRKVRPLSTAVDSESDDVTTSSSLSSAGGRGGNATSSTPLGSSPANSDADVQRQQQQHRKRTALTIAANTGDALSDSSETAAAAAASAAIPSSASTIVVRAPATTRQCTDATRQQQQQAIQDALSRVRLKLGGSAGAMMRSALNSTTLSATARRSNLSTSSLDADDEGMQLDR